MRALLLALTLGGCCGSNDYACLQQQDAALLGIIAAGAGGFVAGYTARPVAPAPVFTSCTRIGNTISCLGY